MFESFIGINFWTALFVLLNTLAVYFVAKKFLFVPVKEMIDSRQKEIDDLYQLIAQIQDPAQVQALFDDLCTLKELENMAERLYAAELLLAGNTYNQVMALADISSATLSRVSRCVQQGEGYCRLLKEE